MLAEAVAQRPNIRPLFNKTVESIHGGQSVEGAALLDTVTGERTQLPISAVFVAIGMQPDNGLFAAAGLDENGYIQADESCTTRLPGGVRGGGHPHQVASADHYRRGRRGGGRHPGGALPGNRGAGAIGGGAFTGLMVDAVAELWYA